MGKLLFTPGPTNVPTEIREVLGQDLIHHRMGDYQSILGEVKHGLKAIFNTEQDVIILSSSGTGSMESAIVNLFSPLDEVLVINTGAFGKRFIEICEVYGICVHELKYEWGETYQINDVETCLKEYPQIKGIFVTYHETATGVVNDLKQLGELTKETERLLITDCISGMVVQEFHFDDWGIDCAVASSQKGFLLPPGISFVALSCKATKAIEESKLPKYYWDYRKYLQRLEPPFTPAIGIVVALRKALETLLSVGLSQVIATKIELREYTQEKFKELGFSLFIADDTLRGNVMVPVVAPSDVDIQKLVTILDERYDLTVSNGMGSYAYEMLRIGIIGEITKDDIDLLINRIKEILPECRKDLVK